MITPRKPGSRGNKDSRFFYGWWIVVVMAVGTSASMAMGSLNFGLFIVPMGEELNIGRSTFGWSQSIRQLASAVTSPIIGPLLDKFGARILLPAAALIAGAAMIGLSFIESGWQLILLFRSHGTRRHGRSGSAGHIGAGGEVVPSKARQSNCVCFTGNSDWGASVCATYAGVHRCVGMAKRMDRAGGAGCGDYRSARTDSYSKTTRGHWPSTRRRHR